MSYAFDLESLTWEPVRPDIAEGVYGKTLVATGGKVVFTRVAPGGRIARHRDTYRHLLHFLGGTGRVEAGTEVYQARPGLTVCIAAGEEHSYENTGSDDLVLLSLNIPVAVV